MRSFEYANPRTEAEALDLLNDHGADTAVLAGGTDLITLLRRELVNPKRVVDIKDVKSLYGVRQQDDGVIIGALSTLEEIAENPLLKPYRSLLDVADGHRSIQIQQMGTLGGDLCHLPHCWYYRNGCGLLAFQKGESLAEAGDNRYHAILGNRGPAKFVSASRFAPALIAWGAKVRIIGPAPDQEELLPLEYFYRTPNTEKQGVTLLEPGQLVSHVWLPSPAGRNSAAYEVLESEGLDRPLAAASCCLEMEGGVVRDGKIVMGHVAPIPWITHEAVSAILNRPVTEQSADQAGRAAVAGATPLSHNQYKVQLALAAVKRALLRAAGLLS